MISEGRSESPPVAFVIMPFAPEMHRNYDLVIKPALKRVNVRPVRADEEQAGHIHDQMFARIVDCDLVIADVSGTNPNVFYELGVSHALRGRTLMVVREDCAKAIPFDVMPYRIFIFRDPGTAPADAIEQDVARLSLEIARLVNERSSIVPNPVQDFLASRSPVTSSRSVYLSSLSSAEEEKAILATRREISYVGVSASSCVKPIVDIVESGRRTSPLHLRLGLLGAESATGWQFLFNLREGRPGTTEEIEDYLEENRLFQKGWIKKLSRLAERNPQFSFEAIPIRLPLHLWAFMIDRERIIIGHFAIRKETATGMPVTALVESDPVTRPQFDYYYSTIEKLLMPIAQPEANTPDN